MFSQKNLVPVNFPHPNYSSHLLAWLSCWHSVPADKFEESNIQKSVSLLCTPCTLSTENWELLIQKTWQPSLHTSTWIGIQCISFMVSNTWRLNEISLHLGNYSLDISSVILNTKQMIYISLYFALHSVKDYAYGRPLILKQAREWFAGKGRVSVIGDARRFQGYE